MQQSFDIQKVKQGETIEFKRFFDFLYPRMMSLACRFVNDEDAKDIVQETFADFWGQRYHINIVNEPSYLYKSVQNKCLNHIRHQEVVDSHAAEVKIAQARMEYLASHTDDNELFRQISDQNLRELIETSVQKLPPKCQEAFRLCYFHEMTSKEASEIMGLSHRTVEGHVQKALVHLREDLGPLVSWLILTGFILKFNIS